MRLKKRPKGVEELSTHPKRIRSDPFDREWPSEEINARRNRRYGGSKRQLPAAARYRAIMLALLGSGVELELPLAQLRLRLPGFGYRRLSGRVLERPGRRHFRQDLADRRISADAREIAADQR